MSSCARSLVLAATAVAAVAVAAPALAREAVVLRMDEGTPVSLSGAVSQVVGGNPSIADATVIDRHRLMVLGRSYGTTNVVAFDAAGRVIYDGSVVVVSPSYNHVTVYRGTLVHNFACGDHCERTPMPGEVTEIYNGFAGAYSGYADRAKAAAGPQGGSGNP